jgi:hypothetical protein
VTLAGPIVADLFVSTTGTDADYVVKLIDVFPDSLRDYPTNDKAVPMAGYQMLVRGEVLRGRYRNSFEDPEPFVPGEVTSVRFEIPAVLHTFEPGHRIMVQVQNSWFPLVDRNPQKLVNIYEAGEEDFQKATHRVYHDRASAPPLSVRAVLCSCTPNLPKGLVTRGRSPPHRGIHETVHRHAAGGCQCSCGIRRRCPVVRRLRPEGSPGSLRERHPE